AQLRTEAQKPPPIIRAIRILPALYSGMVGLPRVLKNGPDSHPDPMDQPGDEPPTGPRPLAARPMAGGGPDPSRPTGPGLGGPGPPLPTPARARFRSPGPRPLRPTGRSGRPVDSLPRARSNW